VNYKLLPEKSWEDMESAEQDFYRKMSEEDIVERWHSDEGDKIIEKIIEINFSDASNDEYSKFIGKIKADWGKKEPKYDLRGLNLSEFSNFIEGTEDEDYEYIGFNFSNCLLQYSDFSNAVLNSSDFTNSDVLYSDFSNSNLDNSNFANANLTHSNFDNTFLEHANLCGTWMTGVSFENADLGYIKYNRKTNFYRATCKFNNHK
jgi:uncharacterized protein YjbI with pentapeptide repeats